MLDELDSLNTLPKLTEGMTMMRSTGHVLVLGMQNTAQLEDRYGRQANTIFSQAGTKMILAVSEPNTAKSLQDLFGEVEIRRYRESRTGSFFGKQDRNNFSGPEDIRKAAAAGFRDSGIAGSHRLLLPAAQRWRDRLACRKDSLAISTSGAAPSRAD